MKKAKFIVTTLLLLSSIFNYSQQNPEVKKIKITGKIIEKITNQPLEYATLALINAKNPKAIFGGITNAKGEFEIDVNPGIYNIKFEFISFKPTEIKQKSLFENTNLGNIFLEENASQLNEVVVTAEKSTVEIKLDKKVYNVGKDMTVKGGTASDVLNNVPSVTVDTDGNVSLRGNENVKIFIDGRPSNSVNIATALQTISADAIEKIEVISNPSARYDAEGGAGILNIVLKKGKNNGLNGTVIGTVGNPKNNGLQTSMNFKSENFNFFSALGFVDAKSLGKSLTDSNYLDANGAVNKTINERSNREMGRKGHNYNFGIELNLDKSSTWTNAINFRKSNGLEPNNVLLYNHLPTESYVRNRFTDQNTTNQNIEYTTNFTKKFKKDGHKFTVDFTTSKDNDNDYSVISTYVVGDENNVSRESTKNLQIQSKNLLQTDYVLPLGKSSQFEAGYKGDFNTLTTDYGVGTLDNFGNYTANPLLTNVFNYKENINAGYAQFGSKLSKFSYLVGLRFEDSKIDINLLTTNNYNSKHYQNFFPSAFLTYPISDNTTLSLNYSRRINRPRNRFINPFAGYSSDVNIFQGNPDINPALTNSLDFGLLTKIKKVTITTSLYYNNTKNPFQFIRRPNGNVVTSVVNGVPINTAVLLSTPINLDSDERIGLEFTANFSPFKWWKLNSNFNFFRSKVTGDYTYTLLNSNTVVNDNFGKTASSWFTKLNSKISLPYKIDWQTNAIYTAPQNTAQGKSLGVYTINLAFSKDLLKDKATLSLNVSDLFNSSKMIRQFDLPTVSSYSEMQRRERQINLSFTYRFNKKIEKEKPKRNSQDDGNDFQG
jgi:outer membrane receptor for ferrienterochelin and colicins